MDQLDVVTTVPELREHMSGGADRLNIFVATSTQAYHEGYEQTRISDATSFQIEGFVLHPRRMEAARVEIVTEDAAEVDYILTLVDGSQGPLAAIQAEAVMLAGNLLSGMRGLPADHRNALSGLGEMVEREEV